MLKSEAVDLESLPVYMDFQRIDTIKTIFEQASKRQVLTTIDEITTPEHQQIDQIVFDYLGLSDAERSIVISTLKSMVLKRAQKAST